MKPPVDLTDLAVSLRRIEGGDLSRVLDLPRQELRVAMSLKPDALSGALLRLAELTLRLPQLQYSPTQQGQRRRLTSGRHITAYRNYSAALRRRKTLLGAADAGPWPSEERLAGLVDLMGLYGAIARYTADGVNKAMDLRLLLGALQFYMLGEVTRTVVAHLEDPALSKAERTQIQTAFSGLLAHKEQLLLSADERRVMRKRMNEEIAAQIAASEERTQLLDTLHAVTLGVPVDQASLEQAALAYAAEKERQEKGAKARDPEARRVIPRGGPKRPN